MKDWGEMIWRLRERLGRGRKKRVAPQFSSGLPLMQRVSDQTASGATGNETGPVLYESLLMFWCFSRKFVISCSQRWRFFSTAALCPCDSLCNKLKTIHCALFSQFLRNSCAWNWMFGKLAFPIQSGEQVPVDGDITSPRSDWARGLRPKSC